MGDKKGDLQDSILTEEVVETKEPPRYKVLLHNDDYTTMEFVIYVLQNVFRHTPASSTRLMLAIHRTGLGVAGVYTKEIAETLGISQTAVTTRLHRFRTWARQRMLGRLAEALEDAPVDGSSGHLWISREHGEDPWSGWGFVTGDWLANCATRPGARSCS